MTGPYNEREAISMNDTANQFWLDLGRILAVALDRCPRPELESLLMLQLQDKCSVYSVADNAEAHRKHRRAEQDRKPGVKTDTLAQDELVHAISNGLRPLYVVPLYLNPASFLVIWES
jgi:hypothetical protein